MKKTAILATMACLLFGCDNTEPNKLYKNTIDISSARSIQIVKIDSCEYIYLRRFAEVALVHKGDCKHCKSRVSK